MRPVTSSLPLQSLPLRLLDQLRQCLQAHRYNDRAQEIYVHWVTGYILFHHLRHPRNMGATEIRQYLVSLVDEHEVAGTTYIQALCALLFLYKKMLKIDVGWIDCPEYIPRLPKSGQSAAARQRQMPLPALPHPCFIPAVADAPQEKQNRAKALLRA